MLPWVSLQHPDKFQVKILRGKNVMSTLVYKK